MEDSPDGSRASLLGRFHQEERDPCPYLPAVSVVLTAGDFKSVRNACERDRVGRALLCAQSLWMQGLPGQALLMLNHAMATRGGVGRSVYQAVAWIISKHRLGEFMGNPRRHYQHLATRMNETPLKALRVARAWNCWLLTGAICPDLPNDEEQVAREGLVLPTEGMVLHRSSECLGAHETEAFEEVLREVVT